MTTYNAEVSAGSLMPLESRRIAAFLLTHPDDSAWKRALIDDNILQKKASTTAIRQASLIRKRLNTLDATALEMLPGANKRSLFTYYWLQRLNIANY